MFQQFCSELHTSILQAGKWLGQQLGATSSPGHAQSRLFYITNYSSRLKFPINTGAEICVVPHLHTHRKTKCNGSSLQATNNTTIPTYGTCSLTVNLGLWWTLRWVFTIADVSKAILHLLDPLTLLKVQGIVSWVTSSLVFSFPPTCRQPKLGYQKILMDLPAIMSPYKENVQIKHKITQHFETKGSPECAKPPHHWCKSD